ncbi:MAG TPA: DUF2752 domain-containing protein [Acidimicrobiales bacterium]|jgi:hypothetical protein|nr:DUF2752 domain-containing protein [Acidimicrobiales bacterium]
MYSTIARRTTWRAQGAGLVAAPIAAAVSLAAWDPARRGGPPLCPLRACTGVSCPGCGLTRAAGSIVRGRWHEAMTLHPLIPLVLLELAGGWLLLTTRRFGRSPMMSRTLLVSLLWLNVAAFFGLWLWRLHSGWIHVLD